MNSKKITRWAAGVAALVFGMVILQRAWHNAEGVRRIREQGLVYAYEYEIVSTPNSSSRDRYFTSGNIRDDDPQQSISRQSMFSAVLLFAAYLLFRHRFGLRTMITGIMLIALAGAVPLLQASYEIAPSVAGMLPGRVAVSFEQSLAEDRVRTLEAAIQPAVVLGQAPQELRDSLACDDAVPLSNVRLTQSTTANGHTVATLTCLFEFSDKLTPYARMQLLDYFAQEFIDLAVLLANDQGIGLNAGTMIPKRPVPHATPAPTSSPGSGQP